MKLSTHITLFRIRLPGKIRRMKRKIKQFFCSHDETHFTFDWNYSGHRCVSCRKTIVDTTDQTHGKSSKVDTLCHICGIPNNKKGGLICSASHSGPDFVEY